MSPMMVDQKMANRTAWPDVILPGQYFSGRATTPEARLMLAILEDALGILLKPAAYQRRRRALRAETEQWLLSNDTAWPFSFLNVCHALALDPGWLRGRVLAQRAAEVHPAA
jgi:hypothetical protein